MKFNLKNKPNRNAEAIEWHIWATRFEDELREMLKDVDCQGYSHCDFIIKEILGE